MPPLTLDAGGATPIGWYVPARTTPFLPSGTGPGPALRSNVTGYAGGNLRPTEYGATAAYGDVRLNRQIVGRHVRDCRS